METSRLLSTADIPAPDRFGFWSEVVTRAAMPIDVSTSHTANFDATIHLGSIGAIDLMAMDHPPMNVSRTARLIRRSDPDAYHLVLSTAGNQQMAQDRKEVVLRPGDMTLYHSSRALQTRTDPRLERESAIVVMIPTGLLPLPPGKAREVLATRLPGDDPLTSIVIAHIRALHTCIDRLDPAEGARLSTITLDLIGQMLARRLDAEHMLPPDSLDRALFFRIQSFVERNLGQPGLNPETLADAHHISLRALHRQFRSQGLTAAGWIRTRRLENCRRDLGDPLLADRPVAAIAARWGFTTHTLGRAFKAAYGLSPSAFRQQGRAT